MKPLIYIMILTILQCCSSSEPGNNNIEEKDERTMDFSDGAPLIIYKTKADYSKNVAVSLSEDKSQITSYPHPGDVSYNGKLAYPFQLENGYLIDNQGINKNVAFLSMTLEQYSKLKEVPALKEMYALIIDKDPLTEMYFCGNRSQFKDEIVDLNKIVKNGKLKDCKCLTE